MDVLAKFYEKLLNALEFHSILIFSITFVGSGLILLIYSYISLRYTQVNRQIRKQIKLNKELSQFDNLFEEWRENYTKKVKERLDQAGIIFSPQEYVTLMLIAMGAGGLYGFIFNPLSAVAGDNYLLQILLRLITTGLFGYLGVFIPKFWVHILISRKQSALKMQISDALLNIADAIRSGHIIESAIRIVGEQMPYPIGNEFSKTANEIDTGKTLSEALQDLKRRIDLEDFELALNAIEISFETGGKLEALLREIVDTISERESMRREMEKSISGSKGTGYILMAAPLVLGGMFTLANPKTYAEMFVNPTGLIMLGIAAGSYALGAFIIFSILSSLKKE